MALQLTGYQITDYLKGRAEVYQTEVAELKELIHNPPSIEPDKQVDNKTQDILLMLMEDEIVTTQVRLEAGLYQSIIPQVQAFRDMLVSFRFVVGMLRKDRYNTY